MLNSQPPGVLPHLRTLQIIVVALIMGVITFAGVAHAMRLGGGGPVQPVEPILRYIAIGMTVAFIPLSIVLRTGMLRVNPAELREADGPEADAQLTQRFSIATIMPCALLEGAALFAIILYMMGGEETDLIYAGVSVAAMVLFHLPTRTRWESFIADYERRRGSEW